MKNKQILFVIILIVTLIFQTYGLVRYYFRLPDDILGQILYLITILLLLAVIIVLFKKSKK